MLDGTTGHVLALHTSAQTCRRALDTAGEVQQLQGQVTTADGCDSTAPG